MADLVTQPSDPTTRARQRFPGLSSRAYEHPADRAALVALRKIRGFDTVLRKLFGFVGERSLRYVYLGSAVRVGPKQFSSLYSLYRECTAVLDLEREPELYVSQTPLVNAGAVGVERPFIVLNSGTVELFDEQELRFIIGHELGHVLSDHVLYKTMLQILLRLSAVGTGIPLGGLALFAIISALNEWDRKSELSADRAALLCTQDAKLAFRVMMKMAGGSRVNEMDVDEFVNQAEEYEQGGDFVDGVLKLINLLGHSHPFPVLRLAELKRWAAGGDYGKVLAGDYPRRQDDPQASVYDEVAGSVKSYGESVRDSQDPLASFVRDIGEGINEVGQRLSEQGNALWDEIRERLHNKAPGAGDPRKER